VVNGWPSFREDSAYKVVNKFNTSSNILSFCLTVPNILATNTIPSTGWTDIENQNPKYGWYQQKAVKTLKPAPGGKNNFQKWFLCKWDIEKNTFKNQGNLDNIEYGDYVVFVGKDCQKNAQGDIFSYLSADRGGENLVITTSEINDLSPTPFFVTHGGGAPKTGPVIIDSIDSVRFVYNNTALVGCWSNDTDQGTGNFDVRNFKYPSSQEVEEHSRWTFQQ